MENRVKKATLIRTAVVLVVVTIVLFCVKFLNDPTIVVIGEALWNDDEPSLWSDTQQEQPDT